MKELIEDAQRRMEGAVSAFGQEMTSVRTGRASVALLDRVQVEAYGTRVPLNQVATLGAPEPRMLTVSPFDKSLFAAVEKGIQEADLGLNPTNDGQLIRIVIPQLSEDRRKDLVRQVHKMAEDGRIAVRNVRRDVINEAKRLEKDGDISQDEIGRFQTEVQKVTDQEIANIDEALARKEAEIMEV